MRYVLIIIILSFTGCAELAELLKVPPHTGGDQLRYNHIEDEWEYSDVRDTLKYNHHEKKWEFAR